MDSMADETYEWAVVVDRNIVDRYATPEDAAAAIARGGYPDGASVAEAPESDFPTEWL